MAIRSRRKLKERSIKAIKTIRNIIIINWLKELRRLFQYY